MRPLASGEPDRWQLRVSAGPDPARPGRYLLVEKVVGPLTVKGRRMTEKEAGKELAKLVAEVEAGRHRSAGATFGDLLDRYMTALETAATAKSTMKTYRGLIRVWIRPRLGHLPLAKLSVSDFDRMYTAMAKAGRAPSTINQAHAICRKACNLGVRWGWLASNPTARTTRPPVRYRARKVPPIPVLLEIIVAAQNLDPDLGVLLQVAAGTGARRGEICGIQWEDISWDAEVIQIRRSVGEADDGSRLDDPHAVIERGSIALEEKDTKSHQVRPVDVPTTVMQALKRLRQDVDDRAAWAGVKVAADGFVFSREPDCSTPLRPNSVTAGFERARDAAGVSQEIRLHDLRHLFATLQLAKGIPVATVSQQLGHGQISTTHNFYNVALPGSGREGAALLDQLLGFDQLAAPKELPGAT